MKLVATIIVVLFVVVLFGAYLFIRLGYAPVATASASLPFEKWIAQAALHARIQREAPANAPFVADTPALIDGASVYVHQCAVCHGLPGGRESAIAKGMFPKPPQLFEGQGVTDDPAGETYWKVANGIRLSGMPGFRGTLSDREMWEVSQLLAGADKLPSEVRKALLQPVE